MRKDLITTKPIYSSFFSCDKDIKAILKTLFITSKPYSDMLKRLLIINNKDCLDLRNQKYQQVIDSMDLATLLQKGYIRLNPKISRGTHEEIKSYILISLDGFTQNPRNPEYRDYNINFDIVCYSDAWTLQDYKVRPLMICGYIDGILNSLTEKNRQIQKSLKPQIKLSGIGQYNFLGCNEVVLNEDLSMYTLSYFGSHFTEDFNKIGEVSNES